MRIDLPTRGLHLDCELTGPDSGDLVLLVMGLGMQRVMWPPEFVAGLHAAGLRTLAFDNRDIGLSASGALRPHDPLPRAFLRYLARRPVRPAYTLDDMADDSLALLDALGIGSAHVVGASMGGMIGQQLALRAPARVASLVSIMSSAGPRAAPWPKASVLRRMLHAPGSASTHAQRLEHYLALFTELGQHHGDGGEIERLRRGLDAALARAYRPEGTQRQLLAVCAQPDRRAALAALQAPTLVLHGRADPLVPVAAAHTLARAIPRAELEIIEGMGHSLPASAVPRLVERVAGWVRAQR